ncbi:MAG: hypothetical protein EBX37_13665 [Alphaproteobacteria bacterium]|nr:hypothetical protein [Alphaproteobacteria bacterium]
MKPALRLLLLAVLPLVLASCGFEPMYGKRATASSGSGSHAMAGVAIAPLPGRIGQIFKTSLEDLLNPSGAQANPSYRLKATLNHIIVPVSVARDGTVSRFNINFTSEYVLLRTADDHPVTSGTLTYVTSYNNLANSYYSTYIAEQDAMKRGTAALAELYRQRLAVYLDAGAPQSKEIVMPSGKTPITPDTLLQQKQGATINYK